MRIRLSDKDRDYIFSKLSNKGLGLKGVADAIGVSSRTVTSWKQGKYNMSKRHFDKLVLLAGANTRSLKPETLDTWWNNSTAGKKGGIASFEKHGQLGSRDGRRLGGKNSYLKRKNNPNSIFARKTILKPHKSEKVAEFIGILIGDGGVTKYQVAIACNATDDKEYVVHIASLARQLFGVEPRVTARQNLNCVLVVISSVTLVRYLSRHGVLVGDKLRQNLDIPAWILKDKKLAAACIRGIFDTDGCVFLEVHNVKGKRYSYPRLAFVSLSPSLRKSINKVLTELKFNPRIRNSRSVNLERRQDVQKYFRLIGSSNPKHLSRWAKFGGVG